MFAPLVAKTRSKSAAASRDSLVSARSTILPRSFREVEGMRSPSPNISYRRTLLRTGQLSASRSRDVSSTPIFGLVHDQARDAQGGPSLCRAVHTRALQPKLAVGMVDNPYEHEADHIAAQVMKMPEPRQVGRECACCIDDERPLMRTKKAGSPAMAGAAPEIVNRTLDAPGSPLDSSARSFMEPRFGVDFSHVRVHSDQQAGVSAHSVNALAYTVGHHVVFSSGGYSPGSEAGRNLLAHELVHVVQQSGAGAAGAVASQLLQRAAKPEKLGTKVAEPIGKPSPFKTVTATFDGDEFVVVADGKPIIRASGQSGHPNQVEPADAAACKGIVNDSYLNNSRYVGVKDKGPIPEGTYTFRHAEMVTFTLSEDFKMALARPGEYVDPSGLDLHGDWGAARMALTPSGALTPARFCGNTGSRSGFYLHGGVMAGSSGCIDIGNSAITEVVDKLMGYTKPVKLTVKYSKPPPGVSALDRAAGRFMYPSAKDPGFLDRVKSAAGFDAGTP